VQDIDDQYGKCVLQSDCVVRECGNDVYVMHGYSEIDADQQMNAITIKSDNRRVYHCYLPFSKCEYDIDCAMDALDEQVDIHSNGDKVDLVGLSFGGMLSQLYATRHLDKVDKLALVFSFSNIHEPYMMTRLFAKNSKHTNNIMKYDLSKLKDKIPNPSLAINCYWDRFLMGDPPIVNGESLDIRNCMHHHYFVPQEVREKIKNFLEGPTAGL